MTVSASPKKRFSRWRIFLYTVLALFIALNIISFLHGYKFTHFASPGVAKTDAKHLTLGGKIKMALTGVDNPRPENHTIPSQQYKTIVLQSNKKIECWSIPVDNAKGTVIIFHGYGGAKATMLDKSDEFIKMGYSTLLVDFMGAGGSEGNECTVGFKEAEEVKTCYDYVTGTGEKNIYLFGTSMGAAAILKALHDYPIQPTGIIIECPFGSLYKTTCARFTSLGAPAFPMAGLLLFWGGLQNNFWAFGYNPQEYAKAVKCPTLLMWGERDEKVSRQETDEIYKNLQGPKQLKTYPLAKHENYLKKYKQEWLEDVQQFLNSTL